MNASQIDCMMASLGGYPDGVEPLYLNQGDDIPIELVCRFAALYSKPDIGYYLACKYARSGMFFPTVLRRHDQWVVLAYRMERDYRKNFNKFVAEAIKIEHEPEQISARNVLRALLVAPDGGAARASEITGRDYRVIEAYESLFFNIRDRREEASYMQNIVYPEGRMVELMDNYLENEAVVSMLVRAGFNNGVDDVAYMAGLGSARNSIEALSAKPDLADSLERFLLGIGLLLGRNGFVNQRRHGKIVASATGLLAAAKAGGHQTQQVSAFGDSAQGAFMAQFQSFQEREKKRVHAATAKMFREADGEDTIKALEALPA